MIVQQAQNFKKISHFILNNGKEVDYDRAIKLKSQQVADEEIAKIITTEDINNERISRQLAEDERRKEEERNSKTSAQLSLDKAKYILEHKDLFTKKEVASAKKIITSL